MAISAAVVSEAKLKADLKKLKAAAQAQRSAYESSQKQLYKTLTAAYMWWRQANLRTGFLERLYIEYGIRYKKETMHKEKFSPLLRYLWNMDGQQHSATIDIWNRALNKIHIAAKASWAIANWHHDEGLKLPERKEQTVALRLCALLCWAIQEQRLSS